ncbi:MAG: hypothetical protein PHV07_04235 [Oscillospiraceae bacterium]|nr:hypothetical protein [Oscillospiraceae bacterium]
MKCQDIILLEDIHLIEGSYKKIEFPCYGDDGTIVDLAALDDYGCTFSYYGDEKVTTFDIKGTIKEPTYNIMEIEILSSHTQNMGDTVLTYCPYLIVGDKTVKPAWGRIIIYSAGL